MFPWRLYRGENDGKILELQNQFVLKRTLTSDIRLLRPITTARTFEWTKLSSKQIRVGDNKGGKNSATTLRLLSVGWEKSAILKRIIPINHLKKILSWKSEAEILQINCCFQFVPCLLRVAIQIRKRASTKLLSIQRVFCREHS